MSELKTAYEECRIERYQYVPTEDPGRDVWRWLRRFLDPNFATSRIREVQTLGPRDYPKDVAKQAKQIGFSIQQAEECFRAAGDVGLATRPNLLYYGAVSLTRSWCSCIKAATSQSTHSVSSCVTTITAWN